jgi:drug/metabolite transporter (DMT)-like permease
MTSSTRIDHSSSNLVAIVAMMASQAVFTVNDALMKLAARELPGGQTIFIRGLFTIVIAVLLVAAFGGLRAWPARKDWPLIGLRNLGEIGATLLYLTALFHMPIAETTAILQFLPLAITAGAALFLGEPVGWRRWFATAVGFVGVLVIIRPGTPSFNGWSLVALASVASIVLRDLATRRIDARVPTAMLTLISSLTVTGAASAFVLTETWQVPTPPTVLMIAVAALFLLAGYYAIIEAMRHGQVAVVAPFRYSVIVWAIIAGFILFGERPDPATLAGTGIVMAAGLYTFFRERQLARQREPQ